MSTRLRGVVLEQLDVAGPRGRLGNTIIGVVDAKPVVAAFFENQKGRVGASRDTVAQLKVGIRRVQADRVAAGAAQGASVHDSQRRAIVVDRNSVGDVVVRVTENTDAILQDLDTGTRRGRNGAADCQDLGDTVIDGAAKMDLEVTILVLVTDN